MPKRMRSGFFLVLWLMAWAAGAWAQPSEAAASEAVLQQVADSPFLKENVRVLCDEIGGRMPGTPAMKQAVEWAVEAFREAGVDQVRPEPIVMPNSWREGATEIEVLAPADFAVRGVFIRLVAPDSPGRRSRRGSRRGQRRQGRHPTVEGESSRQDPAGPIRTSDHFSGHGCRAAQATIASREAGEVEAAGVVFMSTRPHGLLYRHITSSTASWTRFRPY